jgi:hypothetical protein
LEQLIQSRKASEMANQHELWREFYEAADKESNRGMRLCRMLEAQNAMLEHALFLEHTHGTDEECRELEQAADGLRRMKLAYGGH